MSMATWTCRKGRRCNEKTSGTPRSDEDTGQAIPSSNKTRANSPWLITPHLEEVPVLHQILYGQPTLETLAQDVVDLNDLLQGVCAGESVGSTRVPGGGNYARMVIITSAKTRLASLTMSFIVMSSSLLAPSISTLGLMATGGTARCDTTRCSGRPTYTPSAAGGGE